MNTILYSSGWKNISLIDVHNSVTFTLWLCGCNLKCPFCHNWKLAVNDRDTCRPINTERLLDELQSSKPFIDYFHITGGEPLVQYKALTKLLKQVKEIGVPVSLNTNLTLYEPLKYSVENNVVDHIATDLKIPFNELTGLGTYSTPLWKMYVKSLKYITEKSIPLELRVPVAKELTVKTIQHALKELEPIISRHIDKTTVIINPLLSKPVVNPRDLEWCNKYCFPPSDEVKQVAQVFINLGFKTVIKEAIQ